MWMKGVEDIKYESNVSLLYGFEIEYYDPSDEESDDDESETTLIRGIPDFVWELRHGILHASTVDFAGTTNGVTAVVIGVLLGGPKGLHYSTCVTCPIPTIEHHVVLDKFRKLNAHLLPKDAVPKLIAFAQAGLWCICRKSKSRVYASINEHANVRRVP